MTTATHAFSADVRQVLDLVIHSLYSHRDVFLRELLSNASDALDRLRHEALLTPHLLAEGEALGIVLATDEGEGWLQVADNGIGMDEDDLRRNLGSIASSGTRRFLDAAKAAGTTDAPDLIGRFGVGFYSVFMVADLVTVETRKAGSEQGFRFCSKGDGEYTLEPAEGLARGTLVTLHLRQGSPSEDENDDPRKYLDPFVLRELVRRWSDFVEYPIQMEVLEPAEEEGQEPSRRVETLNSMRPIWSRPKDEITTAEYEGFFQHLAGFGKPLETLHFKVEGTQEFCALLFVPEQAPFDLFDPARRAARVALFVRRVRIQEECEELLPAWLRFLVGVVESSDLPLNVSREMVQSDARVRQIQKHLVRRVLEALKKLLAEDRKAYERFWESFGTVFKEGIWAGADENQRISSLCLFQTSSEKGWRTLDEVREAAGEDAKELPILLAPDLATARNSAHLEAWKEAEREVLFLTDPVDEFLVPSLRTWREIPLVAIDRGDASLEDQAARQAREERQASDKDLLLALRASIGEVVREVRYSARLTGTAAVLVDDEGGFSAHFEQKMRQAGRPIPSRKRILELNPDHPLVSALTRLHGIDGKSPRLAEAGEVLLGQALLREGQVPPDPARFATLVSELFTRSLTT